MGFKSKSLTFSLFLARLEPAPEDLRGFLLERVDEHAFVEGVEGLGLQMGWVNWEAPFSGEPDFTHAFLQGVLLLSMRVEERRVPPGLLKKYCAIEEEKLMKERGLKRISKKIKKQIREKVEFALLQRVLPVPKVFDMLWDIDQGRVLFFSTAQGPIALFQELFKKTFDIMPMPVIPYTLAQELIGEDAVKGLSPEVFV